MVLNQVRVGGDVLNGVGRHLRGIYLNCGDRCAVQERANTEVEVGFRAGNRGAEIVVGVADVDDWQDWCR
jgi:hypothetical protein